jgi:hypothetical protein
MTIAKDVAKAYGGALAQICERWRWNTDDGCFQDTRNRDTWDVGGVLAIYQPHKSMQVDDFEFEEMFATIIFKRKDGKPFSKAQMKAAVEECKEPELLLLREYNEILKLTENKWRYTCDGSIEQVARIKKPLELRDNGTISFCFEVNYTPDGNDGIFWSPRALKTWLGNEDLSYCELKEDGTLDEEFRDKLKWAAVPATIP